MSDGTDASEVNLGSETVKATAAKFSMAAIGFVGTIIFARILGPERFGAYYLLFALVKIADLPIDGWAMAVKKRFSEADTCTAELVGSQLIITLLWIMIGVVVMSVARGYVVSYTEISSGAFLFLALLSGEGLYLSAERLLQARGRVGLSTWTDALRSYVTFGLQLILVLSGWGIVGMVYGLAVASLLVTPLTLYYVGVRPNLPSGGSLKSQWEYARYSSLSTLLGRMYERFDVLLLGYLLGPAAAGLYEVALKLVTPARFVAETASSGLMARVSNLTSRDKPIGKDVTNVLAFASILSIPVFLGSLAVAKPLVVTVYGSQYAGAAPLLVVIALYHVVMTQNMPLGQTVYGLDLPQRLMWISAVTVVINILLGFTLVPLFGPVGVAVATLVAELFTYGYLIHILRIRRYSIRFLTPAFLKQWGAGVFMLFLLLFVFRTNIRATPLGVGTILGVGIFVYFFSLLGISGEVRHTIRSVLTDLNIG